MESRAKLLGHPIHQMLIVLPLGLLSMAVIFDVIHWLVVNPRLADAAYWMILAGIISGVVAAVFGVIDWSAIPRGTRANRIGLMHASSNVLALALFGISFAIRHSSPADPPLAALVFAVLGLLMSLLGGWLGGELVDRLGVGVDDGANLNAPSSLTHAHATSSRAPLQPALGPLQTERPDLPAADQPRVRKPDEPGPIHP